MSLILPRAFTRQPQYLAPMNSGHWAYRKLVLAYSTGRGAGNAALRGDISNVVGTITRNQGMNGKYILPANSTSYLEFADRQEYNTLAGVTIVALIRTGGFTVQQGIVTKCETNGGANTPFGLFTESGGFISLNRANSGGGTPFRVWQSAATLTPDTDYLLAVSQGPDISVAPRFYINGVEDSGSPSSLYGGAGAGAPTSNTTSVKIGNRTDLASQSFHSIYDVLVFNEVLTTSEIQDLYRNIWGIYQGPGLRLVDNSTASFNSYTITPSGGIVFAGTNNLIKGKVFLPSGGITFGGTAPLTSMNSYILTPTGGVTFSGSAALLKTKIVIPNGGIVFSGSAPMESNTVVSVTSTRLTLTGAGK